MIPKREKNKKYIVPNLNQTTLFIMNILVRPILRINYNKKEALKGKQVLKMKT